jgi:hypothetical protein
MMVGMAKRLRSFYAALSALALLVSCAVRANAAAQTVTIDLRTAVAEPFIGAGVQWDPYEYPPSADGWKTTLARLDYMQPGFFRVMLNSSSYWLGFDDAGNPRYVWSEGQPAGRDSLATLFGILDYAQARKIDVMLGEWSPPRGMTPADPRWARVIADFVNYLTTVKKYTVIKYYNYMNEPNGSWMWPNGKVDYDAWAAGTRNLRAEFDAHGLAWLRMAGPDNSGNWDWLDRCATGFADRFGAWEMHWYAKDSDVLNGEIERLLNQKREMLLRTDPQAASKPRFVGEAGMIEGKTNGDQQPRVKDFVYGVLMADYFAQVARAGWVGAIAWDLDDAMHAVNGRRRPAPPDDLTLKIWGFWNTQGTAMGNPKDEAPRPWFYTWALMGRLFPKGSRIVAANTGENTPGVRALAATWKDAATERLSVMVVNDSDEPRTFTVRAAGGGMPAMVSYRYFDNDRPVDKDGYPVASATLPKADLEKGVNVEMPSRGVAFLTTR